MIHPLFESPAQSVVTAWSTPTPPFQSPSPVLYQLRGSRLLPSIDCFVDVQDAFLCVPWLEIYRRMVWNTRLALTLGLAVGTIASWFIPFLTVQAGQWVACLAAVALLPGSIVGLGAMRYDMVVLLLSTYEFWYVSVSTVVSLGFLAWTLNDPRSVLMAVFMLSYENLVLIDANTRAVRAAFIASAVGSVMLVIITSVFAFGSVAGVMHKEIVTHGGWVLNSRDVLMNGQGNVLVLLLRNTYRMSSLSRLSVTKRCLTYRTRVKFEQVNCVNAITSSCDPQRQCDRSQRPESQHVQPALSPSLPLSPLVPTKPSTLASSSSSSSLPPPPALSTPSQTRSTLRCVSFAHVFDARHTIFMSFNASTLSRPIPQLCQTAWTVLAVLGLSLMPVVGVCYSYDLPVADSLATTALVCSLVYCVPCFALQNPGMLRVLAVSFDFLFLSLQHWMAHLTACYLYHWDHCSLLALTVGVWLQWAIMIDALLPVVKAKIGLTSRMAMWVLAVQMSSQLLLCIDLLFLRSLRIDDRVLWTVSIRGQTITFYAVPFLLTRIFTLLCWCCRLLWRLAVYDVDDLVMVQGAVEYDDYRLARRLQQRGIRCDT